MGTNSSTSLTNFVLLVTLSSSVISLPYDSSNFLIPQIKTPILYHTDIVDWKDNAFNNSTNYSIQNSDTERIKTILGFSQKVLANLTDIDSEYVDIVNENFWELI
jgi:hypothetical protein